MTDRGNTGTDGLEATMKRLEKLREYRSRLFNDVSNRVDKYLADGCQPSKAIALNNYVRKCQLRIRLINAELDRHIAADPRVLQPAH